MSLRDIASELERCNSGRVNLLIDPADAIAAMRAAWGRLAGRIDASLTIPAIRDHLIENAWSPLSFDSLARILRRVLDQAPWLESEHGYGWVTQRSAYDFPAEALNQYRLLNTLAAFREMRSAAPAFLSKLAVRETTIWHNDRAGPEARQEAGWRFVIVPYGWDNFSMIALRAFIAYAIEHTDRPAIFVHGETADWRSLAKGLLVNAGGTLTDQVIVDSVLSEALRQADPWFEGAVISIAEFADPLGRTLGSLAADFVIGHETAHHLLHGREAANRSLAMEAEADRAALFALWNWQRDRDLTNLPERGAGFWSYVSALLSLMLLVIAAVVERAIVPRPTLDPAELRARFGAVFDLAQCNPDLAELTASDHQEAGQLVTSFQRFVADLTSFCATIPPSARLSVVPAMTAANEAFFKTLQEHRAKARHRQGQR